MAQVLHRQLVLHDHAESSEAALREDHCQQVVRSLHHLLHHRQLYPTSHYVVWNELRCGLRIKLEQHDRQVRFSVLHHLHCGVHSQGDRYGIYTPQGCLFALCVELDWLFHSHCEYHRLYSNACRLIIQSIQNGPCFASTSIYALAWEYEESAQHFLQLSSRSFQRMHLPCIRVHNFLNYRCQLLCG